MAIFSDNYGVVFPNKEIEWYNKHPSKVTDEEFKKSKGFDQKLVAYDEIWFYYNLGHFNRLTEEV